MTPLEAIYDFAENIEEATPLAIQQRTALALVNLDSQVKNGGYQQWHDNGFAIQDGPFLISATAYHNGKAIAKIREHIKVILDNQEILENPELPWDELDEDLERLDTEYYALKDDDIAADFASILGICLDDSKSIGVICCDLSFPTPEAADEHERTCPHMTDKLREQS